MSILKSTNSGIEQKLTEKILFEHGFKVEYRTNSYFRDVQSYCEAITYKNWKYNFYVMWYNVDGGKFFCHEYYNRSLQIECVRQLMLFLKLREYDVIEGFDPIKYFKARDEIRKEYNIKS